MGALWLPPKAAFPVFRPYVSQLEVMRHRHNQEDNAAKSNRTFWLTWYNVETKAVKEFANEAWDTQQYESELALFKKLWPDEFFPGQCPNQYYVSHLKQIEQKAHAAGIPRVVFDHICDHVARARSKDPEPDPDIKQYRAEKALWDHFWTNEEFPGMPPYTNRINRTSVVSNAPGATSLDNYNDFIGLAEHQQFHKEAQAKPVSSSSSIIPQINAMPIKKEKVAVEQFTMEDLAAMLETPGPIDRLAAKAVQKAALSSHTSTNPPGQNTNTASKSTATPSTKAPQTSSPAFATGDDAALGKPLTIDAPYVSNVSDAQVSLAPDKPASAPSPTPHIAVVDSLLGYISKDMNLMVALSKAIGCNIYSDKVPGSNNLTWIFVEAWPEWPGCATDKKVLDRAHSIVEKWCKLSVEEFWKEVTSTNVVNESGQDGARKRRRMV